MNSPWVPFIYQYSIFTLFIFAIVWIAIAKNVISLSHPTERKVLIEIVIGYLFFILLHASMIVLAGV